MSASDRQKRRALALSGPATATAALLLACAVATAVHAQSNVDVDRFTPALDANGFLEVQGTRTPGNLRTSYGLFLGYGHGLLEVERPDGSDATLVSHRLSAQISQMTLLNFL